MSTYTHELRPELEPVPERMQTLAVDERGYVVPWFVDYVDGKPEFRAMDPDKWMKAVKYKKCWVCGEQLGRYMTFVAGPMCGINRTSGEPPSHHECAHWSARNCPFLSNPDQVRRVDETVPHATPDNTPGFAITRNPGVTMLWTTKDYSIFDDGKGMPLISFGEPVRVEWYSRGKVATREEVIRSIESGLPALMALARTEQGGVPALLQQKEQFMQYLPT